MAKGADEVDPEIERLERRISELSEVNAALERENDDWRRAEHSLRERELESRLIMDNIPNVVSLLTSTGTPERISWQILNYAGKTEQELKEWGASDLVHSDDRCRARDTFQAGILAGVPFEIIYRMRRHDGIYRWFHARHRPLKDQAGRVVRWCVAANDIDDVKRAEEILRESDKSSRLIVNTIPGFVALFSPEGVLDGANEQFLGYLGLTLEEAGNWAKNGAVHVDDLASAAEAFSRALASGQPYDFKSRIRGSDGVYRWFQIRGNPARDADGRTVRWYGLLSDIDVLKRAEEDRRLAEGALSELRSELAHMSRASSLGVLTASVAHEVNQPLAGIITNASTCLRMLAANPPNVDGALETARRTMRDGTRAAKVVGRLRTLFLKQTAKSEEVDLNEAAAEVVPLAAADLQRNGVSLRLDFADELPRFSADRVQLQQVILNLLLNASDAMKDVDDRPRLAVIRTSPDGDGVKLSVEDVGIGFAGEDIERFFQAFYTTKSSGMGMGLSVSRSIVESHNGRIWGERNHGPGATFSFSIPVAVKTPSAIA